MRDDRQLIGNRYQIINKIGEGSFGVVYRAEDRLIGDIIALKRLTTPTDQLMFASRGQETHPNLSLAQEFRTLASLRHPHIISVLDYGFDHNRQPYFTMELLENPSTILEAGEGKPVETRIGLLIELLQALTYLHRRAVLHRDLKPANVLVTEQGKVKVLDFGLSTTVEQAKGTVGTLSYMAPEVLRNQPAERSSDLFAVGIIAYQLLTGRYPFDLRSPNHAVSSILHQAPDFTTIENSHLASVVMTCLEKDPAARYGDADEVIQALSQAIDQLTPQESIAIRESYLQTAPFVGRANSLAQLARGLEKMLDGHGSLWLVGGESGVGKSRLLDELRIPALVKGVLVVRGQSVDGGGLPYQLWRDVLPRLILSIDLSDLEAGVLKPIVPDIDTLIGRDVLDAPALEGAAGQQRLIQVIADVLRRQSQPLVLLLEDLQWTVEGLAVLKHLAQFAAEQSWLLIGTYRQDERPDLPDEFRNTNLLNLKRLNESTIAELSNAMLGEAGRQPEVLGLLQRETEGNAFFLVEIVRALAEEAGQLADIGTMTLPDTVFAGGIQRINQRRLSRVPEWGQPLLKRAAVIGRQLDETLMRHLAQGVSVENWLNACADAAVLEVTENRWRFSHDKLRETVMANLTDAERPLLHKQVAQAIETIYPDDSQHTPILADHWHVAGDREKEAVYAFKAAESLLQLGLNQAQELAIRALMLKPSDALLWAKINILVAENYFTWGEYQKAREHYEVTLAHARQHNLITEQLAALDGLGQITYITRDLLMALDIYQDAIDLARKANNRVMLAHLLEAQGVVLRFIGDHEAAYQAAKASLDIIRTLNNPSELSMILYGISVIVRNRGQYQEAIDYLEESIAILRELNAVRDLGMSLNNLGICNTLLGNYEEAQQHLEEGLAVRRQVEHVRGVAASKSAIGELYWVLGRHSEAENMFQEALDFWQSIDDRWNVANSHNDVAFPLFLQGEVDRAAKHWRDGLQSGWEIKAGFVMLKSLVGFAWLAHHKKDEKRALLLLSLAQSHESSTRPLEQMWIQPLMQKMDAILPPAADIDLQEMIIEILDTT